MAHLKNIYTPVFLGAQMVKTEKDKDPKQLQQQMASPSLPFLPVHNFRIDNYENFEPFSPVDEDTLVAPTKTKTTHKRKSIINASTAEHPKEQRNIPWTHPEELVLAKAWVNTSEENIKGNVKPLKGLWVKILSYFQNEMKVSGVRTYDSLNGKWKELRLKVGRFCVIHDNINKRNQSGANEELILQQAIDEYNAQYDANFVHLHVWRILKDEPKWIQTELPKLELSKLQGGSSKKSKTSDSTSFNTSESAHGGSDLNNNREDGYVEEVARPMGKDKSKKKPATTAGSLAAPDDPCYEILMQSMKSIETTIFDEKKEQWAEFIAMKQKEIELRNREIDIQQKQFQFLQDKQRQKDILFYISPHDHFTGLQLKKVLQIKNEIKEKYGLDY